MCVKQYRKTADLKVFFSTRKKKKLTEKSGQVKKPLGLGRKTRCVDGYAFYDRISAITEDEICA